MAFECACKPEDRAAGHQPMCPFWSHVRPSDKDDEQDVKALQEILVLSAKLFEHARTNRARLAEERGKRTELEAAIRKLADSLDLGSGNPHISGADEKMMRHVSERLLALVGGKTS